jgi:hypothetical protein
VKLDVDAQKTTQWGKGFLRLWILLSLLWLAFAGISTQPWSTYETYRQAVDTLARSELASENARLAEEAALEADKPSIREGRKRPAIISAQNRLIIEKEKKIMLRSGLILIIPILLMLFLGMSIRWVVRGFRAR